MAAYAEGMNILRHANAGKARARGRRGDRAARASRVLPVRPRPPRDRRGVATRQRDRLVAARPDGRGAATTPGARDFAGRVSDSGEGRWTSVAAIERACPRPCSRAALFARFPSRGARRVRRQGAVGDAQAVRRPRGEGRSRVDGQPDGHSHGGRRRPPRRGASRRRDAAARARDPSPRARGGLDTARRRIASCASLVDAWSGVELWLGRRAHGAARSIPESNYRMLAETLLGRTGAIAHPVPTDARPRTPPIEYEERCSSRSRPVRRPPDSRLRDPRPRRGRSHRVALPPRARPRGDAAGVRRRPRRAEAAARPRDAQSLDVLRAARILRILADGAERRPRGRARRAPTRGVPAQPAGPTGRSS